MKIKSYLQQMISIDRGAAETKGKKCNSEFFGYTRTTIHLKNTLVF